MSEPASESLTPGEDRDLLAELAALLRRVDPVPGEVRAAAERLFALAFVPDGWTRLEPVAEPAPTRSGTRSFRFRDKDFFVKVDVRGRRLAGLVSPVAEVGVCWPSGSRHLDTNEWGFFQTDDLPRGPLRVIVGETHATRWFWP